MTSSVTFFFFFKRIRRREREKHQCESEMLVCLLHALLGIEPDRESNQQPSGVWDDAQPNHNGQGSSVTF